MRLLITRGYGMPPRYKRNQPVDTGAPATAMNEFIDGMERMTRHGGKPHPWDSRRKDVLTGFQENIVEHRTPRGFTEAWRPLDHDVATTELAWLEATQDKELPPEWLQYRSNGVRGESLDRLVELEDGSEVRMADMLPNMYTMEQSLATYELVGGMRQIEAFLKADDEQKWFSGHTRRYVYVVNDEGKRGIVPTSRRTPEDVVAADFADCKEHLPDADTIHAQMEYREQQHEVYQDAEGRTRHRMKPGTYGTREDMRERAHHYLLDDIDAARVDEDPFMDEEMEEYKPNSPCPNENCEMRGDECRLCFGSKYILHTIGTHDMDWPPPGWIGEREGRIIRQRKSREARQRLSKDIRDIKSFKAGAAAAAPASGLTTR